MSSLRICPAYVQTKVPMGMSSSDRSPHPLKNKHKTVNNTTTESKQRNKRKRMQQD